MNGGKAMKLFMNIRDKNELQFQATTAINSKKGEKYC